MDTLKYQTVYSLRECTQLKLEEDNNHFYSLKSGPVKMSIKIYLRDKYRKRVQVKGVLKMKYNKEIKFPNNIQSVYRERYHTEYL